MIRLVPFLLALCLALPAVAERVVVQPGGLAAALAAAAEGDEIVLSPGRYAGPVVIGLPLTLTGEAGAVIDAGGTGSVVMVDAPDVTVRGLTLINSGRVHEPIDAGVKLTKKARRAQVLDNDLKGNLVGVDIHGARDALVQGNRIEGLRLKRMNDRGNGIYEFSTARGGRTSTDERRAR